VEDEHHETKKPSQSSSTQPKSSVELDILGAFGDMGLGGSTSQQSHAPVSVPKHVILPFDKGNGLQISSAFSRRNGEMYMDLLLENNSHTELRTFALKFNKNFFGVNPSGAIEVPGGSIAPGSSAEAHLRLNTNGEVETKAKPRVLQIAIKTELGVLYFQDNIDLHTLFSEHGHLSQQEFLGKWKTLTDENEQELDMSDVATRDSDTISKKLTAHNVFFVTKRNQQGEEHLFMSLKIKETDVLLQLIISPSGLRAAAKSDNINFARGALYGIQTLLMA